MKPQIITTDTGEELVVLSRREYDSLLACLGDEAAEDRMAARIVAEGREAIAEGREVLLPAWLGEAIARGETPVRAARKHAGKTQVELAAEVGITQGYLSDIERGAKGGGEILDRIAAALDIETAWLRD